MSSPATRATLVLGRALPTPATTLPAPAARPISLAGITVPTSVPQCRLLDRLHTAPETAFARGFSYFLGTFGPAVCSLSALRMEVLQSARR